MADNVVIKADVKGLEDLMRSIKGAEKWRVRVGILGSKAAAQHDSKSGLTNSEIGTFHEFGTSKMPARSFLYQPLSEKLSETDWRKEAWKDYFVKFKPQDFYKYLTTMALTIVQGAFDTGGYEHWKPLTASTLRRQRGTNKILMDTRTLRDSITTKVYKR